MPESNFLARLENRLSATLLRLTARDYAVIALHGVTLLCASVFLWLVYESTLDKETEFWGKAFLLLVFALSLPVAFLMSYEPGDKPLLKRMMTLRGAVMVLAAVFVAFGTVADAVGMFEPRAATTEDTDRIESRLDDLNTILQRRFPDDPPILEGIVGRWGEQEPACGLVWEISIIQRGEEAALVAEIIERPETVDPFRLLADITSAEANTLSVIGEEPASARGTAAVFTLNSATQRLTWDDKTSLGGVEEYMRCP